MKKLFKEFFKGIGSENPIFRLVLGLCPALAVSTSVVNGLGMGIAATFVLLGSNIIISLIRKFIPDQIRIPCFIVIIATFVTIVELAMKAYAPELSKALGIFVPLIVVNCIVLGRAEAFACKEDVLASMLDALGMGVGFTFALLLISAIRELLGNGTFLGFLILKNFDPILYFMLAPGALLVIGLLIGGINFLSSKRRSA
ncbi:MAG: electron transport complex subunit E [Candidatus Omnitrophota bacterium]|nr:electron transport complex subunit E [Candidatus Omnitrophota bacterium]